MLKKLRRIYTHFGKASQEDKLYEEIYEYLESGELQEAADIFVLLLQKYIHSKPMRLIVDFKIDRTLDRMDEGYVGYEGLLNE